MLDQKIEKYTHDHSSPEDPILSELNRETHLKVLSPRMLSGHPQGKLLEIISKMHQPKKILEIGTFSGYSAICLAKGLKAGGELHTIEMNDELTSIQDKYFTKAGLNHCIYRHIGDAMKIIPTLNFSFDLVFIDADKKNYTNYFNMLINKITPGGIIIADNVLWYGKVVTQLATEDPDTAAIDQFNKTVAKNPLTELVMLPMRDGISIIRKKNTKND